MKEEGNVETYLLRVDKVLKSTKGLGETLENSIVVKKVIRSLLDRYDPKFLAIEESRGAESPEDG